MVLTPGQNAKRYVAGALNPRTGTLLHVSGERKNSSLFIGLIERLLRGYRRAQTLHLVLDNYIIHKSRKVLSHLNALAGRIRLHFLPPYSPQENLIERLWKQLHDHVTRNHQHKTLQGLMADVETFLHYAQPFPGTRISTLRLAA